MTLYGSTVIYFSHPDWTFLCFLIFVFTIVNIDTSREMKNFQTLLGHKVLCHSEYLARPYLVAAPGIADIKALEKLWDF